jgi:hypothetical protein
VDYSGYREFPFPSGLDGEGQKAEDYFMSLPDGMQLKLLDGCKSYDEFYSRVLNKMKGVNENTRP